jgi:hypothetical protein
LIGSKQARFFQFWMSPIYCLVDQLTTSGFYPKNVSIGVVKEFTFNRCPAKAWVGQMMTPDRESCCGVVSRHDSLIKNWIFTLAKGRALWGICAACKSTREKPKS